MASRSFSSCQSFRFFSISVDAKESKCAAHRMRDLELQWAVTGAVSRNPDVAKTSSNNLRICHTGNALVHVQRLGFGGLAFHTQCGSETQTGRRDAGNTNCSSRSTQLQLE